MAERFCFLRPTSASARVSIYLAACLPDTRQAGKVDHQLAELMRQRVYGLACGYEYANDAARIGRDPIHKRLQAATVSRVSIWLHSPRCRALRTASRRVPSMRWA